MPAFLNNIGPTELVIILAIVFFIFGRKVLISLGKTGGETVREFKKIKKSLIDTAEDGGGKKGGE